MAIDEKLIERYIRYPETLSEAERKEVETQIRESEKGQRIAAFYREYYEELDALEGSVSPAVKAFIKATLRRKYFNS